MFDISLSKEDTGNSFAFASVKRQPKAARELSPTNDAQQKSRKMVRGLTDDRGDACQIPG